MKDRRIGFLAQRHREGTETETFLLELPGPESIISSRRPSVDLLDRVKEAFASFAFQDLLRIVLGKELENRNARMPSPYPKIEEISNGTENGHVPSKLTVMVTSQLEPCKETGNHYRSPSIRGSGDPTSSSFLPSRVVEKVRRGTHCCDKSSCRRRLARLSSLRASSLFRKL